MYIHLCTHIHTCAYMVHTCTGKFSFGEASPAPPSCPSTGSASARQWAPTSALGEANRPRAGALRPSDLRPVNVSADCAEFRRLCKVPRIPQNFCSCSATSEKETDTSRHSARLPHFFGRFSKACSMIRQILQSLFSVSANSANLHNFGNFSQDTSSGKICKTLAISFSKRSGDNGKFCSNLQNMKREELAGLETPPMNHSVVRDSGALVPFFHTASPNIPSKACCSIVGFWRHLTPTPIAVRYDAKQCQSRRLVGGSQYSTMQNWRVARWGSIASLVLWWTGVAWPGFSENFKKYQHFTNFEIFRIPRKLAENYTTIARNLHENYTQIRIPAVSNSFS